MTGFSGRGAATEAVCRKVTDKCTACIGFAGNLEPSFMVLKGVFDYRQAQASTTAPAGSGRVHPVETLRKSRYMPGFYTYAGIANGKMRSCAIAPPTHSYLPSSGGVL